MTLFKSTKRCLKTFEGVLYLFRHLSFSFPTAWPAALPCTDFYPLCVKGVFKGSVRPLLFELGTTLRSY